MANSNVYTGGNSIVPFSKTMKILERFDSSRLLISLRAIVYSSKSKRGWVLIKTSHFSFCRWASFLAFSFIALFKMYTAWFSSLFCSIGSGEYKLAQRIDFTVEYSTFPA